ncbi:hypothetical protein RFI_20434 [Reticulomyxa filosa]|uniref:Uncharacterized protein n=1 Tax=Reticulomyxa filosa TaxID=46433 RepID=X6MSH4_RETFI|nr:hypothetical protein RFI_20434 [Reticulomyxa filosa]|eukprot:ETO16903.1 hypothetical protein RFI_20434 [Reticulomyxa filosa]
MVHLLFKLFSNYIIIYQQLHVIQLLEVFSNKMDKTIILKTWKQFNYIYLDTLVKLKKISSTYDISKLRFYGSDKKKNVYRMFMIFKLNKMKKKMN